MSQAADKSVRFTRAPGHSRRLQSSGQKVPTLRDKNDSCELSTPKATNHGGQMADPNQDFMDQKLPHCRHSQRHRCPPRWRHFRPRSAFEGSARRFDSAVNVLAIALGDPSQDFASRRIVGFECLARSGFNPFAIYEHLPGFAEKFRDTLLQIRQCCCDCHFAGRSLPARRLESGQTDGVKYRAQVTPITAHCTFDEPSSFLISCQCSD
jgi:hypothetical protein